LLCDVDTEPNNTNYYLQQISETLSYLVKRLRANDFSTIPFLSGDSLRQLIGAEYAYTVRILWRARLGRIHEGRRHYNHLTICNNKHLQYTAVNGESAQQSISTIALFRAISLSAVHNLLLLVSTLT